MSEAPEFPTTAKIGWKRFTVVDWNPETAEAAQMFGECDHAKATIRVDTSHSHRQSAETLLHECLHAAMEVGKARFHSEGDIEEDVVSYFASWMTTIMCDNPELRGYYAWATGQES